MNLRWWYGCVRTGKRIVKGMERTLDSFGISPPRSPLHIVLCLKVRIASGFPRLTACLSCPPNTVCSSSESCPSNDRALSYFDNYGEGRVGHGFYRAALRDEQGTKMEKGRTCIAKAGQPQNQYVSF